MAWGVPTVKTTVRGAKGVGRDDTGWNCLRMGHFPVMVSFATGPEVQPLGYDRGSSELASGQAALVQQRAPVRVESGSTPPGRVRNALA